jgi:NDP-sugar pyrophosphorylase family protein
MKAMILAAGLGTRLRPLTNDRPKALVEVAGHTLLEIALKRLDAIGVRDVIINVHHYADMILHYVKSHDNFGMRIEFSREEILLDTGGGLKRAANFFLPDGASSEEPFILHNVDVISTIDLGRMMRFHAEHNGLATLAVQDRETSRYLLFNEEGQLCGRRAACDIDAESDEALVARSAQKVEPLAFSGVHIISSQIFSKMNEEGAFSIIDAYLRLAAEGERIIAFRADNYYWRDLGRPESVVQAAQDIASGRYSDT